MSRSLTFATELPVQPTVAFSWHARPSAFERLAPPWDPPTLSEPAPPVAEGALVRFKVNAGPLALAWMARLSEVETGRRFVDTQVEGPFAQWRHQHEFLEAADAGCRLEDRLEIALPLGRLGSIGWPIVASRLRRLFAWRHHTTRADLELHQRLGLEPLKVMVTGASGFLGRAVTEMLETGGHQVIRLVRREAQARPPHHVRWIPGQALPDPDSLEGCDALVHLAGAGIADGRWSKERKALILSSRRDTTAALLDGLAQLKAPPATVVVASAVGYYGDRPSEEMLDEASEPGTGFLAEVVSAWEEAASRADPWARRVSLRFGVILDPRGGALAKMLPAFKFGGGGRIGSGEQSFPWVARDDAAAAVLWALGRQDLRGAVNVVAPMALTQHEFAKALGRVLGRPTLVPLPAALVELALGEMGREMLLAGQRVFPGRLLESGFRFRDPDIDQALRRLLGHVEVEPSGLGAPARLAG